MIRIRKNSKYSIGWNISPVFSISLHKSDLTVLKKIKYYFNDKGLINKSHGDV
ncbi:hypothetical protein HGI15_22620 [Modestobacter lapidis]|nr:hypothetical protein [Modestobacter lapidis]